VDEQKSLWIKVPGALRWLRQTVPVVEGESAATGEYRPIPAGQGPNLFINMDGWDRFSRCPECDEKTRLRVFNVTVMVEPDATINLRLQTPYCPHCDLLIVHMDVLYEEVEKALEFTRPELVGNDFMVRGSIDNKLIRQRPGDDSEQQWIEENTVNFRSSKIYTAAWTEEDEREFEEFYDNLLE
jgi:hypothetical protein